MNKPSTPGWYWRRRYNDGRSKWKPVEIPGKEADAIDRCGVYEYVPIPYPEK